MKSENIEGFTIEDLMGADMPFDNYSCFSFNWKTTKYYVTKVEFDITAEESFKTTVELSYMPFVTDYSAERPRYSQEIELQANEKKHVVFNTKIKKTSFFDIYLSRDMKTYLIKNKVSNLVVTAEKI